MTNAQMFGVRRIGFQRFLRVELGDENGVARVIDLAGVKSDFEVPHAGDTAAQAFETGLNEVGRS